MESDKNVSTLSDNNSNSNMSRAMLWHVRLGHPSVEYLRKFQLAFPEEKELKGVKFDQTLDECEICKISKFNKLPFSGIKTRANQPLQIIHTDVMGKISPPTYPKQYKWISVFIDDYSRVAMAYPMRTKDESGKCLELFVRSARNLLGHDAKVCYLRSDQGKEVIGGYTIEVLNKLEAELQLACSDTP